MNAVARRNLRPLPSRAAVLHAVRLFLVVSVLLLSLFDPVSTGAGPGDLAVAAAAYLIITTAAGAAGHLRGGAAPGIAGFQLLVDGVYLAWLMALSGGTSSRLLFLVFAHLIVVTLLLSYRTGLKVAMWHSLLLIAVHYVDPGGGVAGTARRAALTVAGFWLVAIATAACSSLNERALRRGREQLDALTRMVARLDRPQGTDEVVDVLLFAAVEAFGFRRAAAVLDDGGPARLRVLGADGAVAAGTPPVSPANPRPPGTDRSVRLLARLDHATHPALAAALPEARNVVLAPLLVDGAMIGAVAFELGGRASARVSASSIGMLTQFTAHASLAFGNARLLHEVRRLASTDPLTGVANRRAFDEGLARELSRARRYGEPLSLVLVDVDHFKRVNDAHGHQVGDDVLRHLGRRLRDAARPMDLPARYGGEEFAVILPSCGPEDAVAVAERLRLAVVVDAPVSITASAGVATLHGGMDADGLVTAADRALYAAKRAGRDRTHAARRSLSAA
jgi:two-component system, cell cycle response regulator